MSNQTMQILKNANSQEEKKYNILTFDTHERYQTQLCKTGHNFYSFRYDGCKEWDESYAKMPENYYVLPKNAIIGGVGFDMILSQSKFGQFQAASQIQQVLQVPIVSLEHTLPIQGWPKDQLDTFKNMMGQSNVFISDYSVSEWGMNCDSTVIHHSVDTETFKPKDGLDYIKNVDILSVVSEFPQRDYCCNFSGWQRIVSKFPFQIVDVVGKDSEQIPNVKGGVAENLDDLVNRYNACQIFLNTSTVSPVPTSLLEAMSCGCAVVSTATCMIPEIIQNGVNGFISNDEDEIKKYIQKLLVDKELADRLGKAARETIIEKFSEEKFINKWNETFNKLHGAKK